MSEMTNKIETDDPDYGLVDSQNNAAASQMNRYSIEHPQGLFISKIYTV
jgi:hypothetical protein